MPKTNFDQCQVPRPFARAPQNYACCYRLYITYIQQTLCLYNVTLQQIQHLVTETKNANNWYAKPIQMADHIKTMIHMFEDNINIRWWYTWMCPVTNKWGTCCRSSE